MTMKTAALRFCLLALLSAVASSHMMGGHGMMRDEDNMMMGGGEMMMGDCPYAVRVAGKDIEDGTCIESPLDGVVASLSWNDQSEQASSMKRLLVWDTEAPCGDDDMVYVHFAGDEDGRTITNKQAPMTAGAGPKIHTYMAGWFDQLPVPAGSTGCQMMNVEKTEDGHMKGCDHTKKWKVARHSTPCPEESGEFH